MRVRDCPLVKRDHIEALGHYDDKDISLSLKVSHHHTQNFL